MWGLQFVNLILTPFVAMAIWPLLITTVLIVYTFRQVVLLLAKYLKPGWIPVPLMSIFLAMDKLYEKPNSGAVITFNFKGLKDYEELLTRVENVVKDNKHPDLRCTLDRWMGTMFLKPIPSFSFRDNVVAVNFAEELEEQESLEFRKPYKKDGPLWEIILFPNVKPTSPDDMIFAIRFHHSVMDGLALFRLLRDVCDADEEGETKLATEIDRIKRKHYSFSFGQKILFLLNLIFIAPFEFSYEALCCWESHSWASTNLSGDMISHTSVNDVRVQELKQIAKSVNRNITTVLYTAFTGALRDTFQDLGERVNKNVTSLYVLPLPREKDALGNGLFIYPVPCPISMHDPVQRVEMITPVAHRLAVFTPVKLLLIFAIVMGSPLFAIIGRQYRPRNIGSLVYSNIPFFGLTPKIKDSELQPFSCKVGLQMPDLPLLFFCVTYGDKLVIYTVCDSNIMASKEEVEKFNQAFVNNLRELKSVVKQHE